MTTATAPYNTFDARYFADSAQNVAWENLQFALYRATRQGRLNFGRDASSHFLHARIDDGFGNLLVVVTLKPFHGTLSVNVYGTKGIDAVATFEHFQAPVVFSAVVAFILAAAER